VVRGLQYGLLSWSTQELASIARYKRKQFVAKQMLGKMASSMKPAAAKKKIILEQENIPP